MSEWIISKTVRRKTGQVAYVARVIHGQRGEYRYVLDTAYSKRGKRREIQRQCSCGPTDQCNHEEQVRQVFEYILHDEYDISWSRIEAEAPIPDGSRTLFADIAILKNENIPAKSDNYEIIVELKRLGKSLEQAREQLFSYMRLSSARSGLVWNGQEDSFFIKLANGDIIPQDDPRVQRERLDRKAFLFTRETKRITLSLLKEIETSLPTAQMSKPAHDFVLQIIRKNISYIEAN